MSAILDALLVRSPMQLAYARRNRNRPAVLAYHGVDAPEQFAEHLDWLVAHHHVVDLDTFAAAFAGRQPWPAGATLITFDDGDRSIYDHGLPLLRERGLPAVAFVVSELIDTETAFWWRAVEEHTAHGGTTARAAGLTGRPLVNALKRLPDTERRAALEEIAASSTASPRQHQLTASELREMSDAGIAIGNHTDTHPCLDRCDETQVSAEIERAHSRLGEMLDAAPRAFAYPNGDYTAAATPVLSELGYDLAFLFDHTLVTPGGDPFAVSRLRVNSHTSMDRFRAIMSGMHPGLHALRGGR